MPRREGELIGHATCPECEFTDAEVRKDRNGHPYRKCTNCKPATVYLTRGAAAKVWRLMSRTRPLKPKPEISRLALQLADLHGGPCACRSS